MKEMLQGRTARRPWRVWGNWGRRMLPGGKWLISSLAGRQSCLAPEKTTRRYLFSQHLCETRRWFCSWLFRSVAVASKPKWKFSEVLGAESVTAWSFFFFLTSITTSALYVKYITSCCLYSYLRVHHSPLHRFPGPQWLYITVARTKSHEVFVAGQDLDSK